MMRNRREKGKIPVSERPRILAKYAAGEKIAHIAREYGCTPAAIRYILKRSNHRSRAAGDVGAARAEQRLQAAGRPPQLQPHRGSASSAAGRAAFSLEREHIFLDADLYMRATGDAVTFLAALDRSASEGSRESLEGLREAIERLMRSAARTSLEVGRLLDAGGLAGQLASTGS
jgi:transposase-like protein